MSAPPSWAWPRATDHRERVDRGGADPQPHLPRFREAFSRRSDGDTVLGTGQPVLDELGADERQSGLVPAVLLMVGATLARLELLPRCRAANLEHVAAAAARHRRHPRGGRRRLVHPRAARPAAGDRSVPRGLEPHPGPHRARPGPTRPASEPRAPRSRCTPASATSPTAQQLLNTASGLAERVGSRQLAAMVDADRAIVLAEQGRTVEAAVFADQVLPQLARPGPGPLLRGRGRRRQRSRPPWPAAPAVQGDLMTAERMLFLATEPATGSGRSFDRAQLEAGPRGGLAGAGRPEAGEPARRRGGRRPGRSAGRRRRPGQRGAALAMVLGRPASARPLYERARGSSPTRPDPRWPAPPMRSSAPDPRPAPAAPPGAVRSPCWPRSTPPPEGSIPARRRT